MPKEEKELTKEELAKGVLYLAKKIAQLEGEAMYLKATMQAWIDRHTPPTSWDTGYSREIMNDTTESLEKIKKIYDEHPFLRYRED